MSQWYLRNRLNQAEPVSTDDICRMVVTGELPPDDRLVGLHHDGPWHSGREVMMASMAGGLPIEANGLAGNATAELDDAGPPRANALEKDVSAPSKNDSPYAPPDDGLPLSFPADETLVNGVSPWVMKLPIVLAALAMVLAWLPSWAFSLALGLNCTATVLAVLGLGFAVGAGRQASFRGPDRGLLVSLLAWAVLAVNFPTPRAEENSKDSFEPAIPVYEPTPDQAIPFSNPEDSGGESVGESG